MEMITNISKDQIFACDVGISRFCTYGDWNSTKYVENPRWIKTHAKRLRRFQKSLSRKQYDKDTHTGSKNYFKAKEKVAKEHRKIKNQRKDFHHKLSKKIAAECDAFVCETLNIQGMVKNHRLAKEISSCGWGQFLNFVKYKMERKGGTFLKVDRFFPSSQLCSFCGYQNRELELHDRQWVCSICGAVHDRDKNAKQNMLLEGYRLLGLWKKSGYFTKFFVTYQFEILFIYINGTCCCFPYTVWNAGSLSLAPCIAWTPVTTKGRAGVSPFQKKGIRHRKQESCDFSHGRFNRLFFHYKP